MACSVDKIIQLSSITLLAEFQLNFQKVGHNKTNQG